MSAYRGTQVTDLCRVDVIIHPFPELMFSFVHIEATTMASKWLNDTKWWQKGLDKKKLPLGKIILFWLFINLQYGNIATFQSAFNCTCVLPQVSPVLTMNDFVSQSCCPMKDTKHNFRCLSNETGYLWICRQEMPVHLALLCCPV